MKDGFGWRRGPMAASLLLLAQILTASAHAGQSADFDHYRVNYNAFPSTFLTPKVARQYSLIRSRAVGIVIVAVVDKSTGARPPAPVESLVHGTLSGDDGQTSTLHFREVEDGSAYCYIASFPFRAGKMLTFHIKARPLNSRAGLPIRFAQELFND